MVPYIHVVEKSSLPDVSIMPKSDCPLRVVTPNRKTRHEMKTAPEDMVDGVKLEPVNILTNVILGIYSFVLLGLVLLGRQRASFPFIIQAPSCQLFGRLWVYFSCY